MLEIKGKIKTLFDEQTFGSGFAKREFVLTVEDGKYPQDIKFEAVKDQIAQLSGLIAGDEVTVSFNLRGREWNEKYFVNLNAWKVVPSQSTPPAKSPARPPTQSGKQANLIEGQDSTYDEDVPF